MERPELLMKQLCLKQNDTNSVPRATFRLMSNSAVILEIKPEKVKIRLKLVIFPPIIRPKLKHISNHKSQKKSYSSFKNYI